MILIPAFAVGSGQTWIVSGSLHSYSCFPLGYRTRGNDLFLRCSPVTLVTSKKLLLSVGWWGDCCIRKQQYQLPRLESERGYFPPAFGCSTVCPGLGKSPPKSAAGRRKASLDGLRKVKFSSAFGRQPEADLFLMPAPWSATPRGSPSHCSTYLTIINILEAPAACFVLDGRWLSRVQGTVWPLFLYW